MMLSIFSSVSLAPGSYAFCAHATGDGARLARAVAASAPAARRRRGRLTVCLVNILISRIARLIFTAQTDTIQTYGIRSPAPFEPAPAADPAAHQPVHAASWPAAHACRSGAGIAPAQPSGHRSTSARA